MERAITKPKPSAASTARTSSTHMVLIAPLAPAVLSSEVFLPSSSFRSMSDCRFLLTASTRVLPSPRTSASASAFLPAATRARIRFSTSR